MSEMIQQAIEAQGNAVAVAEGGEQVPAPAPVEVPEGDPIEPIAAEAGITIGDQTFATQAEAFAYAQNLQVENAVTTAEANAYRQAVQDTEQSRMHGQSVTPQAPVEEENFEEKFYADPKGYMTDFAEQIRTQTKDELRGEFDQQSADNKLWGEFFSSHPDLSNFKDDCEHTLGMYTKEVKGIAGVKGQKAAMDFLAQKTRAKFQAYNEATKPTRELPNTGGGVSQGSATNVTRQTTASPALDFAAQIRSLRK